MMDNQENYYDPPRRVMKFLTWFCEDVFLEEIEGDLYELFQEEVEERGLKKARRRFLFTSIRYIRPYFFGKKILSINPLSNSDMFTHNFKIAFRHLFKRKFYSSINIFGLALGIAACLLIGLFIRNELSYDRHHENADRIYRVIHSLHIGDYEADLYWTAAALAQQMKEDFPEVEIVARIRPINRRLVKKLDQTNSVFEEGFAYADPSILKLLHLPLVYGDTTNALRDPSNMIISKRMADKYFPDENPVGKQLILNNDENQAFQITGVLEPNTQNSYFELDFILSMEGDRASKNDTWFGANYPTYFLLAEGVKPEVIEEKLVSIVENYMLPPLRESKGMGFDESKGNYVRLYLQPLTDIHLHSSQLEFNNAKGDIKYIWLFGTIAIIILIIACINFVNLSTAQSAGRAIEVGVRKVLGGYRKQIISQFLTESVLISLIALFLGLCLVALSLNYFNQVVGIELSIPWKESWFLPTLIGGTIGIALFSGLYPSFYLSAFRPVSVLKGKLSLGSKSGKLRSTLVVFQFATSVVLIIGTLTVMQQMRFMQSKKLGFDESRLLVVRNTNTLGNDAQIFKEKLLTLPEVKRVTLSGFIPSPFGYRGGTTFWPGKKEELNKELEMQRWRVDVDYIPTLEMNLIAGRNFSKDISSDFETVIINEKAAKRLGFENPIGEYLTTTTGYDRETNEFITTPFRIIGVVEDFHYESLRTEIGGVCLFLGNSPVNAALKVQSADLPTLIEKVRDTWESFTPPQEFQYTFMDESLASVYQTEKRTADIFLSFSIFAIVIACLGLFALATFMVEQRHKEISIRKVLGASEANIYRLLIQHFLKLVFIALIIAMPIGWLGMQNWLADFAYRIQMGWEIFMIAGMLVLFIAISTVSYQAVRISMVNPVEALRSE